MRDGKALQRELRGHGRVDHAHAAGNEQQVMPLEAHPLELAADQVRRSGAVTTVEAAGRFGRRVIVAGLCQSSHRRKTGKGETMLFLSLEDLAGMLDVVIFPNVYRQAKTALNSPGPYLVTGLIEMDSKSGEPFLRAEKLTTLD